MILDESHQELNSSKLQYSYWAQWIRGLQTVKIKIFPEGKRKKLHRATVFLSNNTQGLKTDIFGILSVDL